MNDLLEPVSTVLRIGFLAYHPNATKLSITNHRVFIQEPGFLQSAIRWTFGDTRESLSKLFIAIQLFFHLPYSIKPTQRIQLLTQAKQGFLKLKETYSCSTDQTLVIHSIQYYITQIEQMITQTQISVDESLLSYIECLQKNGCSLWTSEDFDLIIQFIQICNTKQDPTELNIYLHSLEILLQQKDLKFQQLLSSADVLKT